jgi:hypothetical protein
LNLPRRKYTKSGKYSKKKIYQGTVEKPVHLVVQGVGGQISTSVINLASNKKRKMLSKLTTILAPNYQFYNSSNCLYSVTPGTQNMIMIPWLNGGVIGGGSPLDAVRADIIGNATTGYKTTRWILESMRNTMRFTNQDAGNVEVMIYDIATKRDNAYDPIGAFQVGMQNEGSLSYNTPGVKPTMSELFNTMFRIIGAKRIVLGSGQSHSHVVNINGQRIVKNEILDNSLYAYRNLTFFTMIIAIGMPYNDTVNQVSQISTGEVKLDIVSTSIIKYTFLVDQKTNSYGTNSLVTSWTTAESVKNVGAGVTQAGDNQA